MQKTIADSNTTIDADTLAENGGKVKMLVSLSASGMVSITNATFELAVEEKAKGLGDSLKDSVLSFFGGSKDEGDGASKDASKEVEVGIDVL